MNCNFLSIDGTQLPGVNGITVEHITFRSTARALSGQLRVSRLGNAGASAAWVVNLNALSDAQKEFVLYHVLRDTGIRSVKLFNTAPFDAVVTVTTDNYVPRWDASGTVIQHASGRLVLRIEAVGAAPLSLGGIFAELVNDQFVFRDGLVNIPSTFTRASQAWDGTGLVPPDTMRVFGRDTKSPVVLIEGQRTNLLNRSGDSTAWVAYAQGGDVTVTPHAGLAPDGSMEAARVVFGGGAADSTIKTLRNGGTSIDGVSYTSSVWLRADSPQTVALYANRGDSPIDVDVGVEWKRHTFSGVGNGTSTVQVQLRSIGENPFDVYIWGAQIEEAPFASSYIPTDGAPATRARELLPVERGIPAGGPITIHVAAHLGGGEGNRGIWQLRNHTVAGNHFLRLNYTGQRVLIQMYEAGDLALSVDLGQGNDGWHSITLSVAPDNSFATYINGQHIASGEIPWTTLSADGYDNIRVGNGTGTSQQFDGFIAPGAAQLGVPFIDNRAWSAEEIQAAHARWLPELEKIEVPV